MKKDIIPVNNFFTELLKSTPLDSRLRVINEMYLIDFLTVIGVRDGMWKPEEDKLLKKLFKHANQLTKAQLKEFKKWEKDGRPNKLK